MTTQSTQSNLEKELITLENRYWQAIKEKDIGAIAQLTDFPCIVVGAQGIARIDEKEFAAMMKDPRYTLNAFELDRDAKARSISDDVAILAYKAHEELTVDGKPVALDVADSSTWIRRDGRWRCAQHSETIVGDPFGRDRTTDATKSKEASS